MTNQIYIGIDGGGTKTEAIGVDRAGKILGHGVTGSTNRNHYTREQIIERLRDAVRSALGRMSVENTVVTIFLGMSGVSTERDKQDIVGIARETGALGLTPQIFVDNDAVAGLIGGLAGEAGIALVAGTGSICLGVNSRGEQWWAGGWGALADDAGSAQWVGLRAVNAAVRAEDGRGIPTTLREIVFKHLGLTEPRGLIDRVHNQGLERSEIAQIAPLVISAYLAGDTVAGQILLSAARELSDLVNAVVNRLFADEPCPLIYVGGLARSGEPFQRMLDERIKADLPLVTVQEPLLSPAAGAVLQAIRLSGATISSEALQNLSKSG